MVGAQDKIQRHGWVKKLFSSFDFTIPVHSPSWVLLLVYVFFGLCLIGRFLLFQGHIQYAGPCDGRDCSVCQCFPPKGSRVRKTLIKPAAIDF
uniref:Uncharacterized protein n=1 Tax=Callorhinchus milii TaxID=7868 RepID=A0A4W3ICZ7_CALMI